MTPSPTPNILLIMADQHRLDCTARGGHPLVRTPALDRLATEGVWFSHAFTPSPICCPARQSLLCGQWPEAHGGLWNIGTMPLPPFERPTWTQTLAANGYTLGQVGKWQEHAAKSPLDFGFHDWISPKDYATWRKSHGLPPPQPDGERLGLDPLTARWFGGRDPAPLEATRTHWMAKQTIALMYRYAKEGRPWHIRLNFEEPHLPCFPAEPFASLYPPEHIAPWDNFDDPLAGKPYIQRQQLVSWGLERLTWREWSLYVSHYLGMVSQIDDAVGRILAALDAFGLADSTLAIYTSDHGDNCGSHRMIDKHYVMYDNIVRVPLIVRWPDVATAGLARGEFTLHALDLAATMCEAAGLPIPADYAGRSLLPLLRGQTVDDWRQDVTATYNGAQFGLFMQRMLRDRRFKYVWNPTDVDELYDLESDPAELHNRIADPAYANALRELRHRLLARLTAQGDPIVRSEWVKRQLAEGRKV